MDQLSGDLYEIVVKEPIDSSWSEWLEDFDITRKEGKETMITGCVRDQTELYGLLDRLRDLNLTLILVRRMGPR
jgi:hypothetical protein